MGAPLVQVKCPQCAATEVFLASEVGRRVTCRSDYTTRFKLPRGTPFGAAEWDACPVPGPLRQCLKLRQFTPPARANSTFAVALARSLYPKNRRVWLRRAVAFAEAFQATGKAPIEEMSEILDGLMDGHPPWARPTWAMVGVCCLSGEPLGWPLCLGADLERPGLVTDLIREVVPNPFRPHPNWSAWRTTTVRDLAAHIDEAREFSAMPILADALQDAGCDDEH